MSEMTENSKKEDSENPANIVKDDSKDNNTTSANSSTYRYTEEDIDNFFTFESLSMINDEESNINNNHGNRLKEKNIVNVNKVAFKLIFLTSVYRIYRIINLFFWSTINRSINRSPLINA